jgi:hypothetical protein
MTTPVETTTAFTCPRCLFTAPVDQNLRFCPHCGLPDVLNAAADTAPLDVALDGRTVRVLDRIAFGSISAVYRCRWTESRREVEGVFKIARDPRANAYLANEAAVLRRLFAVDSAGRFSPFLPRPEASAGVGAPSRQANLFRLHEAIRSPADELYTLTQVRQHFTEGLPAPDMAWIWRRLLTVIGFAHSHDVVHTAVLPDHVLIEPREHKLVLVGWSCAIDRTSGNPAPTILTGGYRSWYDADAVARPGPWLDVALAARSMIDLVGGDAQRLQFPPAIDPALQRYFSRCAESSPGTKPESWKLLEDFDKLIEALWGRRRFRVFEMPPKVSSAATDRR